MHCVPRPSARGWGGRDGGDTDPGPADYRQPKAVTLPGQEPEHRGQHH